MGILYRELVEHLSIFIFILDKKCTKKMGDKIKSGEDNAMKKVWFQDFYPLGRDETAFLKGLRHSPVAFGGYISENYYAYVSGKCMSI